MRPPLYVLLNVFVRWIPSMSMRQVLYRWSGVKFGAGAGIMMGTEIIAQRSLAIGDRSVIGQHCLIDARGGIEIGEDTNISSFSRLITAGHDAHSDDFRGIQAPIRIGDHVWIATGATVLPGVTIGKGAVVAAGAVVTGYVEPLAIVAGIPARVVARRRSTLEYRLNGAPPWH